MNLSSLLSSRKDTIPALLFLLLMVTCAYPPRRGGAGDATSREQAERLFSDLRADMEAGDFASACTKAKLLTAGSPDFPWLDEVYFIAAKANFALGKFGEAVKYARSLSQDFPTSSHREEALLLLAQGYFELGRYTRSADAVAEVLSSPVEPELEGRALELLQSLIQDRVGPKDLEDLLERFPSLPLAREVSVYVARREVARGDYQRAYEILADFLFDYPASRKAPEVRRLLKLISSKRQVPRGRADFVDPYRIGVIMPITGSYSLYGRYFEKGIEIALEEYNASVEHPVSIAKADSRGTPIDAVRAVRKLVQEEGVLAVVGSVFSVPTIAASIEANSWGVPFLSPVAGVGRLAEIGPWIFQTRVSKEVEVTAMAKASMEKLLLERYAILAPLAGERRKLGDLFLREIERMGGEVVEIQYFESGETDFREQLEKIREAAPEALFIPASTEELILILPQIRFYDIEVQLLGLSEWNSNKLISISEREIEGALFPLEAYRGRDKTAYQHFLEVYREKVGDEVSPLAAAAYFGMRVLLGAVSLGLGDREQVKDFLFSRLYEGADRRMAEAEAITILTVRSGKVREFNPLPSTLE